jgi:anaerobic selenocysteine-containing dehydrogenase
VEVAIEQGRLVAAERLSPLPPEQRLTCPKLQAAPDIVYSPKRLTQPLIRDRRAAGQGFRTASWDEALERVAERFNHYRARHQAASVAWLRGMAADWGAPWDYANRLMNAFGSPNTLGNGSVCHVARDLAHTLTYGAMTAPQPHQARCILVWGKNDRNTCPAVHEAVLQARRRGARLIVVDPMRTELASEADLWLQIKPAHDGPLGMAMLHEIIAGDLYDAAFVRDWTVGFDALRRAAAAYPAERVAQRLWLTAEQIRQAARLYATGGPACIIDGNGLDMQVQTFEATRAVALLRALTGNLDRPGGDLLPQPVSTRPLQLRERQPAGPPPITCDYGLFNDYHPSWGLQVQSCLPDAILAGKPYPVRMLVVQSGNPVVSMMDSSRMEQALRALDFLVVIDPFMTRTACMADVILPACGCFEKTQLNRAAMRNNLVVLQNAVIEPLGESWPDWKIVFELGRRLGLEREFPWRTAEEAIDFQLQPAGLSTAMLRAHPAGLRSEETVYEKYAAAGFATPSGKVELYSERLRQHGHEAVPFEDGRLVNPIGFADRAEEYPFIGLSGQRSPCFTHSQFHQIPALRDQEPEALADLHPADAHALGIRDGDRLRIATPRGTVRMKARLSEVVHAGSVQIAWGWGEADPACNLNELTDDRQRNLVTGTPAGWSFMCRVEKAEEMEEDRG